MSGRFTGARFVTGDERMDANFRCRPGELANLGRGGGLVTSSVDGYGQGMTGPLRPGPLVWPRCCRTAPGSRPVAASWA